MSEEIEALEAERRPRLHTVMDDSALEQVRAVMTLRGIGIKSSWLFVMEFFSWRQFRNQKEVGSLAGLAPTPNQSSEEDQSPGIEKAGNVWVRQMATEIAWSWVRNQPDSEITRWFERRFAQAGKRGRRRGITAVARKDGGTKPNLAKLTLAPQVASIMLAVWRNEEVYDPARVGQAVQRGSGPTRGARRAEEASSTQGIRRRERDRGEPPLRFWAGPVGLSPPG